VSLPGGWELILVVIVIMVLFGAKRLPDASRSLGRSLRIFKAETKGLRDDDAPVDGYDARRHDREMYERTIGAPPVVPPIVPPSASPPPAPVTDFPTDSAQPRQP
jgi:sec-independent protein translocase protein TatA